jgi:hypothetical protein
MALIEDHVMRVFGRVWIKQPGAVCDDQAVYTFSVQAICANFEKLLETSDDTGLVIADSRLPTDNAAVAHSIFTQKFRTAGDCYPRLLEMPSFGHSRNHAGLQVADLLCSALLFPMATAAYCTGHVANVHVDPGFDVLAGRFGNRLRAVQYRYNDGSRWRGGLTVSDQIAKRSGALLFNRTALE